MKKIEKIFDGKIFNFVFVISYRSSISYVPQLMEEFIRFIAVIIALVMIKQVFDYFHEKRE